LNNLTLNSGTREQRRNDNRGPTVDRRDVVHKPCNFYPRIGKAPNQRARATTCYNKACLRDTGRNLRKYLLRKVGYSLFVNRAPHSAIEHQVFAGWYCARSEEHTSELQSHSFISYA